MLIQRAIYYTQRFGGKWRVARTQHRCDWRVNGDRCRNEIYRGARYFDTNYHNPGSKSPHGTFRICTTCANQEIDV